jgi:conjugal transfer pilus assembly protein TraF
MKSKTFLFIVAALFSGFMSAQATASTVPQEASAPTDKGWWDENPWGDPDRGFNWYPDPSVKPKNEKREAEKPKPKTIYEMNSLEDINKELKRLKEHAILNPTEQNIHEFLKAQDWIMGKSATFADATRRVIWAKPDVNYQARSPAANFARMKEYDRKSKLARKNVQELSKDHGLIFFARSDCNFCHDQAPVLRWVEQEMGIQVIAVSLDGGPIPMYPDAKKDNGISMMVSGGEGIPVVPAIYLVNRETKAAIPIGTGVIAGEELAERIWTLTKTKPGEGL